MSQDILRGGLIGCGAVSHASHLPAWRSIKNARIVAVCDNSAEAAAATARRWGIRATYNNVSDMIRGEKLSFVDICTPPQTHLQLAAHALEAGLHVLVEKPMATSLKEAEEMVRISSKPGLKLCVVHHALFYPVFNVAGSMAKSGRIGDLTSIHIDIQIPRSRVHGKNHWYYSIPGGIFGEHAPHAAYLTLALLGNIGSVKAMFHKCSAFDWVKYDELKVTALGEKGIGTFSISCNAPVFSFSVDITGSKEKIHVDFVTQTLTRTVPWSNRTHGLILRHVDATRHSMASGLVVAKSSLLGQKWYKTAHRNLIGKFVDSVQNNLDTPVPAESGMQAVNLLEQIWSQMK